jgi:hypothetical protein
MSYRITQCSGLEIKRDKVLSHMCEKFLSQVCSRSLVFSSISNTALCYNYSISTWNN